MQISKSNLSSSVKIFVFSVSSLPGRSPSHTLKMKSQDVSEFNNIYCNFWTLSHLKWNLSVPCALRWALKVSYVSGRQILGFESLSLTTTWSTFWNFRRDNFDCTDTELMCLLLPSRISQRRKLLDLKFFIIICIKGVFFSKYF